MVEQPAGHKQNRLHAGRLAADERVLVTGATGLLGWNLVRELLTQGIPVRAFVRSVEKAQRLLPAEVELAIGDITNKDAVQAALKDCSTVFHCAGVFEQWLEDPAVYQVNIRGTQNLVDAAFASNMKKFVYVSTVDVFSFKPGAAFAEDAWREPVNPDAHRRSKFKADQILLDAVRRGLSAVTVHPSGMYGPGPSGPQHLNAFLKKLARKEVPFLPPGAFPVVFVSDVVKGCLLAAKQGLIGERFILSAEYLSFSEMAGIVHRQMGIEKKLKVFPYACLFLVALLEFARSKLTRQPPLIHLGHLRFAKRACVPMAEKAKKNLGWRPLSMEENIKGMLTFLLE